MKQRDRGRPQRPSLAERKKRQARRERLSDIPFWLFKDRAKGEADTVFWEPKTS